MTKRHRLTGVLLSIVFIGIATSAFAVTAGSPQLQLNTLTLPISFSVGSATSVQFGAMNTGDATATGVTLTVTLPAPTGIVWTGNGCTLGPVSAGTQTLQCGPEDLAPAASIGAMVTTTPTALACETLNFQVSVSATNTFGPGESFSEVVDCPALAVTKSADAPSVTSGNPIGFTIGVTNGANATATANNVVLTDTLPTPPPVLGTAWNIGSDPSGLCSLTYNADNSQVLSCPYGNMVAGASESVHVVATTTACGQFSNTAMASADNSSAVSSPQASTTVLCGGLNVLTTADSTPISATAIAGLTTTVSVSANTIPNAAHVTLSQPLPGGSGTNWQVDPMSQAAADCTITGSTGAQNLSCAFSSIAPGASDTVHVTSPTTSGSCQSYSSTATAAADNYASSTSTASLVVQCPAITLSKTADAPSVGAGGTIGFTLTMANSSQSGTGAANNATLTDFLPNVPAETWTISPPTNGCTITGITASQKLSCSASTLKPGDSLSVHVQSATGASACGSYSNTATVTAANAPSQNASASTMVLCPALQVSKTADNATVSAGDQIGYTVSVMNSAAAGTGDATGVTISDTLPTNSGLNWTLASGPAGCSIATGVLSCSIGTLAAGVSATVHVISPTDQTTCGTVSNSATIAAANSATVAPSTAAISVNCPMLSLTNMADAASVNAGQPIGYTLTATNSGAGTARAVTLAETLPGVGGLVWTISPAYAMPGTCGITGSPGAQVLSCSFGNLATGMSAMVHITSPTGGGSCGAEAPTAALSASNAATVMQGATTTVLCPQLQVTKVPSNSTASADDTIGFGITVNNNGAGIADSVMLTDTLPAGPGLSWSISGLNPNGCTISAGVLTCSVGNLNPGGTATVSISSPTTPDTCGTVDNTATATTTNGASAQSAAGVTVGCPNLMVTKTPASNPINAGQNAVFNIVVNNLGPGVARGTTLNDKLPTGVTWSDDSANCKISSGVMTCNFGDLAAGQTQTVHLTGATSARMCGPIKNTATVAATNEDNDHDEDRDDPTNESSTATINLNCVADLSIVKQALVPRVSRGSLQSYLIAVHNAGPSPAQGVVMNDPTPTGTVFASLVADGVCTKPAVGAAGIVNCKMPTLSFGRTWVLLLTVKVTAPARSTITNKATVTGTTVDPNPGNNSSTVSTPVF